MKATLGLTGFEFQGFGVGVIAYPNDFEVSVGPYAVTLLSDGLFLRGRHGERHWRWDEVGAWFTRRPFASSRAV
jgi:hypothetical protein